jgi:hypothetical protein
MVHLLLIIIWTTNCIVLTIVCNTNILLWAYEVFFITYAHNAHALSPKGYQRHLRYSSEIPTFYQNYLAMRSTADVTGGKAIAIWSLSISAVSAINPLVTFYHIHEWKREVLFFYIVPDTIYNYFIYRQGKYWKTWYAKHKYCILEKKIYINYLLIAFLFIL